MPRIPTALSFFVAVCSSSLLLGQQDDQQANFAQAEHYSSSYLRQRTYSTSVQPNWIGKTDRFWYSYRTAAGTRYSIVDPIASTKHPLFDHERLAGQLSVELRKPIDALTLSLRRAKVDDDGALLTFVSEDTKFEFELASGSLKNLGKAPEENEKGRK